LAEANSGTRIDKTKPLTAADIGQWKGTSAQELLDGLPAVRFADAPDSYTPDGNWDEFNDIPGPNGNRRPRSVKPEAQTALASSATNNYAYASSTRDNPMGLNSRDRLAVAKYIAGGMFTNRGSASDFTPDMLDQVEFLLKAKTQSVNADATQGVGLVASDGVVRESTAARMDREARAPGANTVEKQMESIMRPVALTVIPGGPQLMFATGAYDIGYGGAQAWNGDVSGGSLTMAVGLLEVAGSYAPIPKAKLGERLFATESSVGANTLSKVESGSTSPLVRPSGLMTVYGERTSNNYVLSGHGIADGGTFVMHDGTYLNVYAEYGASISNELGNLIETGGAQKFIVRTYGPGDLTPSLILKEPHDLNLVGGNFVLKPTPITEILKPNMGVVDWAACLSCSTSSSKSLVYSSVGVYDSAGTNNPAFWKVVKKY